MSWGADRFEELPYRFHLPGEGRWPVVIYLHGSGERGDDGTSHLKNGVETLAGWPCITVAPQCPRGASWGGSWYGGPTPQQEAVAALAESLAARPNVDGERISVVGFSMGAIGGWELVARHRARFAAFVPIAGDAPVEAMAALQGFPVWAFHGALDAAVPNTNVREAARLGVVAHYTELPGVDHGSWGPALETPHLRAWLLGQRRGGR